MKKDCLSCNRNCLPNLNCKVCFPYSMSPTPIEKECWCGAVKYGGCPSTMTSAGISPCVCPCHSTPQKQEKECEHNWFLDEGKPFTCAKCGATTNHIIDTPQKPKRESICGAILFEDEGYGKYAIPSQPDKIIARCGNLPPCSIHHPQKPAWEDECLAGVSWTQEGRALRDKIATLIKEAEERGRQEQKRYDEISDGIKNSKLY